MLHGLVRGRHTPKAKPSCAPRSTSGYFNGGGYDAPVYDNVDTYLPTYGQDVLVDRVTYLGHDDTKPAVQQDWPR